MIDLRAETEHVRLQQFLERHDHRLEDVYRGPHSWTELRRAAGQPTARASDEQFEARSLRALSRLTHIDDPERVAYYRELLDGQAPPSIDRLDERRTRLLTMLCWGLGSGDSRHDTLSHYLEALWRERAVRDELGELLAATDERSQTVAGPAALWADIPLVLHGRYARQEVISALGFGAGVKPKVTQGGILWVPQANNMCSSSTYTKPSATTHPRRCIATLQ